MIFTDKSTIWLEQRMKICFRKEGRPGKLIEPKSKLSLYTQAAFIPDGYRFQQDNDLKQKGKFISSCL